MAAPANPDDPFLVVENLTVKFPTHDGLVQAVTDLSYTVERGKTLGIVGESGSGKSVSSMAVLGLHDPKHTRLSGSIRVDGIEVIGAVRGPDAQDPRQQRRDDLPGRAHRAAPLLHDRRPDLRGLPDPPQGVEGRGEEARDRDARPGRDPAGRTAASTTIPHQFSGGMRQRAMIAMALVNDPQLLIADEPTTALDVTVQAQILDLLQDLQREFNSAVIIITHDLGVVAEMADDDDGDVRRPRGRVRRDPRDPDPPRDALHLGPPGQHPGRQWRRRTRG